MLHKDTFLENHSIAPEGTQMWHVMWTQWSPRLDEKLHNYWLNPNRENCQIIWTYSFEIVQSVPRPLWYSAPSQSKTKTVTEKTKVLRVYALTQSFILLQSVLIWALNLFQITNESQSFLFCALRSLNFRALQKWSRMPSFLRSETLTPNGSKNGACFFLKDPGMIPCKFPGTCLLHFSMLRFGTYCFAAKRRFDLDRPVWS